MSLLSQQTAAQIVDAMRDPTPRNSIVIRDVSGREIARMKVEQAYQGFLVEAIGEILPGGNPPTGEERIFSGTYKLMLKGAGGARVFIIDGQDPEAIITLTDLERQLPKGLWYNDNVAEFDTF
jgi:hypothetical protein